MFMFLLFALLQRMAEPTPFLPPFFPPPEISSFWKTSIGITPSGTQEVLSTPVERKYSTGSSLLTSSPINHPDIPTLLYCSSGSHSSTDISFAPSSLALSCSREVLQNLGSDHLPILLSVSLSLWPFAPTSVPPFLIFRKHAGMTLPSTLSLTVLLRGILFSFSFLCCCSLYPSSTECSQIFYAFQLPQTPS